MILKTISIEGMHNVMSKSYNLKNLNYLYGKNGAGKSTVLQAIQLAVLGYIPGSKKQNVSIMKHGSGKVLTVTAVFDDNGNSITISRTFIRNGSTIQSSVDVHPEGYDISTIINPLLESPVFNFNEFINMSSNAQKSWFLKVLPSADSDIHWITKLKTAAEGLAEQADIDELLEDLSIDNYSSDIEGCNNLNAAIKSEISLLNALLKDTNGIINSAIMYDDINCTAYDSEITRYNDLVAADNARISTLKASLSNLEYNIKIKDMFEHDAEALKAAEVAASDYEEERAVDPADELELSKFIEEKTELANKLQNVKMHILKVEDIANGSETCPYIACACDKLSAHIDSAKKEHAKLVNEGEKLEEMIAEVDAHITELNTHIQSIAEYARLRISAFENLDNAKSKFDNSKTLYDAIADSIIDSESIHDALDVTQSSLASHMETLSKLKANQLYEQLIADVEVKKYKYEQKLACCKTWDKLTGPNGIPSELAMKPFEDFENVLTTYIQKVFKNDKAKFNVSDKSNSFEFGIVRAHGNKFIPFDALSSGEKCAYMVCLLSCIVNMTDSHWKCVILDDVFDHLDDDMMNNVFDVIMQFCNDIQYVLAGVELPCESASDFTIEISK